MGKGLVALGLVIVFIGLFMMTSLHSPSILRPTSDKSTPPQTSQESQQIEPEYETEQHYSELQVNLYLKSEEWTKASKTDLPLYESTVGYEVSNNGTATVEEVQVAISIDGAIFEQFSLYSLLPNDSFANQFTVSINYDDSKHISLTASTQGSKDTDALTVNAILPRSRDSHVAKLYITPNDPTIQQTLENIVKNPLIPDWIEIRDWVADNIEYRYDNVAHGVSEYWQLPKETLSLKTGDCEDFSILLCTFYRAIGWDKSEVYVVVGEKDEERHAWVKLDVDIIGWQNIEPQAGGLFIFIGDFLSLSGYTAKYSFNDVYFSRL